MKRLPWPVAAFVILAISFGMWTLILVLVYNIIAC